MLKIGFFKETEIIERIRANDHKVLGELFNHYNRMVSSYICSHGGGTADAEDMLQEAIVVLWENVTAGRFRLTSKLGTYLLAVAKNKWMAEMRKRTRFSGDGIPDTFNDGNPSSLDQLLSGEQVRMIHRALDAIQPLCKRLLMLFYFEERSMEDIAKILNMAGPDVAKSRKYQCKKALETAFQSLSPETERGI